MDLISINMPNNTTHPSADNITHPHTAMHVLHTAPEVVPPDELKDDPVGGLVAAALLLVLLDVVVDSARGQAAVRQPGGKLGGVVAACSWVGGEWRWEGKP